MHILKSFVIFCLLIVLGIANSWSQSNNNIVKLNTKRSLSAQITDKVQLYEVEEEIDLSGKTIRFPAGSQIVFQGGSIKNGIIEADCLLLNEWSFDNVDIKGNVDFTQPISVPINKTKEFITTILKFKPVNSVLPTVFVFSSNQVYKWNGELIINKKNVTLTGGGTIEGTIHLGSDSKTFKKLKYDAYSATSHANIIISNLRFSKYNVIGTSEDSDYIEKYIETAKLTPDNIAISLVNSCNVKIEGCFFDNVPYPIVYTPNETYVNQNVRRLNIINCDFEFCKTAVYAPSNTENSLEYGDLIFSNNNVLPTYRGLDVSCIDGLKVFNNTFNTCSKKQFGSNIYAYLAGQVVITNNSFYGEYNGESIILDSPGNCLIDGNLFSSQGTAFQPSIKGGIACVRIKRTDKIHYTSGLSITNNLFTKVNRLPIFAEGYFRGANIQGNIVSGTQYRTNKGILYYYNSTYMDETHLQPMKMTDNILEDASGTLELRMDVIHDYMNSNGLYPELAWDKNKNLYKIKEGGKYHDVKVLSCLKSKPIYVIAPVKSSYTGEVPFVFNGVYYTIKVNPQTTDTKLLNDIIAALKVDFNETHLFKIIDNNLWIVGKSEDVPVITPMWEISEKTAPYRFQVVYQNLGYRLVIKDVDSKNFIGVPLYNCGIDSNDDGKIVVFDDVITVLKTTKKNEKAELTFRERPSSKNSYKWIYNDMFFACGDGGSMKTGKLLSEIVSLCYADRAKVVQNTLVFEDANKEYGFLSSGYAWYSTYNKHVVDYKFITANGVKYDPEIKVYNDFGPSSDRPFNQKIGFRYFDTSIGCPIFWDGKYWVDSDGKKR